jgi:hypothetical protein
MQAQNRAAVVRRREVTRGRRAGQAVGRSQFRGGQRQRREWWPPRCGHLQGVGAGGRPGLQHGLAVLAPRRSVLMRIERRAGMGLVRTARPAVSGPSTWATVGRSSARLRRADAVDAGE